MIAVVAAMAAHALVVWPLSAVALGLAVGDPPRSAQIGFGRALAGATIGGVRLQIGALPLGAWVSWGEDRVAPAGIGLGSHAAWALAYAIAGALADPVALGAASRFALAVLTLRSTGVGGLVGGWRAGSEHAAAHPVGSMLAGCAVLAGFNLALELGRLAGARMSPRIAVLVALLPLAWLGWLVWLDL